MISPSWLKQHSFRHGMSVALTVVVAIIIDHYFSQSKRGFLILAAFFVCQTTRGTSLRQGLKFVITMLVAVFIASMLMRTRHAFAIEMVISTTFIAIGYFIFCKWLENAFIPLLFMIMLLITVFLCHSCYMEANVVDIVIGSVIGILFNYYLLPVKFYDEFRQGLLPVLHAIIDYSHAIRDHFSHENDTGLDENLQLNIENTLQSHYRGYPEWVFEPGFNPHLRSGFRFFLIQLEQVTEILFSINYFFNYKIDTVLLKKLVRFIEDALEKNNDLLAMVVATFLNEKIPVTEADYISDINELQNALYDCIPANLELLDISQDYVALTELVRNIKDLRELLLALIAALP